MALAMGARRNRKIKNSGHMTLIDSARVRDWSVTASSSCINMLPGSLNIHC